MIKNPDIPEVNNIVELTEKFKNIKPTENLSEQELDDFCKSEFEMAHKLAEIDSYGELLSDVFNRYEDDIDIDFSIDERTQSFLECFRPENWGSLSDAEKKNLIGELTKAIGEGLGIRDVPLVNICELDDSYGYYDYKNNSITLNGLFLSDSADLVDTIAHEMRHAYQYMRADILETREDALFKVNYENYISPIQLPDGGWLNFTDYYNQYVEVDARAFANKVTEAMG